MKDENKREIISPDRITMPMWQKFTAWWQERKLLDNNSEKFGWIFKERKQVANSTPIHAEIFPMSSNGRNLKNQRNHSGHKNNFQAFRYVDTS